MPAQLLAISDGPSITLDKPILLLGRHAECDIQLNSRKISRRHCCVAQVDNHLVVRDLGSTNGIRINGSRVLEGKLIPGDELTIGNFRYTVTLDDVAPVPPKGKATNGKAANHKLEESIPALPLAQPSPRRFRDEDLEDAEEPVQLDESLLTVLPQAKAASPIRQSPAQGGTLQDSVSMLLPEHLTLVPPSGGYPNSEGGRR